MGDARTKLGSVSREIAGLKVDDPEATRRLWERCFRELQRIARRRLERHLGKKADSEDVASEVFACLCRGVSKNRWPQLENREDLWRILLTLTRHKAIDLIRSETTLKAGRGWTQDLDSDPADTKFGPADIALINDQWQHLLEILPDESLRQIARLRLELRTVPEIATALDFAPRTIERKLSVIRTLWAVELEETDR